MTKKTVILRAVLPLTLFILHSGWLPESLHAQTPIATASFETTYAIDPTVGTPMVFAADAYPLFDGLTLDSIIAGNTYTIRSNADDPHYTDFVEKLTGAEPIRGSLGVMKFDTAKCIDPPPIPPDPSCTFCGDFHGYFMGGGSSSGYLCGDFTGFFNMTSSFQELFAPPNSLLGATVGSISLTVISLEIGIIDPNTGLPQVRISYTLNVFAGGACCNTDGTCTDRQTQTDCEAKNGVYGGDSSDCAGTACAPAGACCDGETCTEITKAACDMASGRWNPDLTCDDSTCDPTPGACVVDGKCENLPRIDCLGQWRKGRCLEPVPTFTEYGLVLFSIMLIGSATTAMSRRKRSS